MLTQKQFILNADLKEVMWKQSWPAIMAMVLFGLNNFMDAVFVGHLMNETALAAVGIAFPLAQIMVGIGNLIGAGAASALSIWIGSNRRDKAGQLLGNVNGMTLLFSLLVSVPLYYFAAPIIHLMGGSGAVAELAIEYFQVTVIGTVFWVHSLAMNMIIRGEGRMRTAALIMGIALIIDIICKPIFIATFGWGVQGAAWGTNVGMIAGSVLGLLYFALKKSSFESNWSSIRIEPDTFKIILRLGMPSLIVSLMMVFQNMAVYRAFGRYGTDSDIAFYATTIRVYTFMLTPLFGLMRALQPVAGMNFGARQFERTKASLKLFTGTGMLLVAPFFIVFMIFPEFVLHLIMPSTVFTSIQIMDFRIFMLALPMLPLILMSMSYLPAINRGKPASIFAMIRQIGFYIPVMLIVPHFFGIRSVYYASFFIELLMFGVLLIILRKVFNSIDSESHFIK